MSSEKLIKCPKCGTKCYYQGNPFRPFCSVICREIDLGHWLLETYAIPAEKNELENEEQEEIDDDQSTDA